MTDRLYERQLNSIESIIEFHPDYLTDLPDEEQAMLSCWWLPDWDKTKDWHDLYQQLMMSSEREKALDVLEKFVRSHYRDPADLLPFSRWQKKEKSAKPLGLREETWYFLLEQLEIIDYNDLYYLLKKYGYFQRGALNKPRALKIIAKKPGPFLCEVGIVDRPDLLQYTVIELEDEAEYVITKDTAINLKEGKQVVELPAIYNKKIYTFGREKIIKALKEGPVFDQLTP